MNRISKEAFGVLKEIIENEKVPEYWANRFESLSTREDSILRGCFKELSEAGMISTQWIEKHFLGMWSKNVYNAAERAKSAIISSKSSNTLHRTLNFTPSLHQMKKTSDVVFKFLTNRKK